MKQIAVKNSVVAVLLGVASSAYVGAAHAQQLAVSPGIVSTIAGIPGSTTVGSAGNCSGVATSCSLYFASGDQAEKMAIDSSGDIYFADRYFNVVRKLTPNTQPGSSGNPYGATTTYTMTTVAGSASPVSCSTATANAAHGIESLAYGDGCAATSATLSNPFSVALNAANTVLFISDLSHGTIRAVNLSSTTQTFGTVTLSPGDIYTVAGTGARTSPSDTENGTSVATSDPIDGAHGISIDPAGNLTVADFSANTVRRVTPGSTANIFTTVVGGNTTSASNITVGTGSTCSTTTNAYGSAPCGDGNQAAPATTASTSAAVQFQSPETVITDSAGNYYIVDISDYRIRLVNNTGTAGTFFGVPIAAGAIGTIAGNGLDGSSGDGGPAANNATYPSSSSVAKVGVVEQIVLDAAGALYFSDNAAYEIRRVDPTGTITKVAGGVSCAQETDAIGDGCVATSVGLKGPLGLTMDKFGNMIFVDALNYVVREINVTSSSLVFGSVAVGAASVAQSFTIYNTSAVTTTFSGISVSANFTQSGGSCTATTTLVAGASCTIAVSFAPQAVGSLTGAVTISSNATDALTLGLSGTGSQATTSTTESISPNPAGLGQTVTMTATVSSTAGAPSGSVTFAGGSFSSGAVALTASGTNTATATFSTSSLSPGTYSLVATYNGATNYATSSSAATGLSVSTLSATTTTLSASTNAPLLGSTMMLTASVASTGPNPPTGSVSFYDGSIYVGSGTISGTTATLTTGAFGFGTNTFTAIYAGDSNNLGSTSSAVQVTGGQSATLSFTPAVISTAAGSGLVGYTGDGGSATAATMSAVNGIAVDHAGLLYMADTGNNVIRVVNPGSGAVTVAGVSIPAGTIATIAGSSSGVACSSSTPSACGDGGAPTGAKLNSPAYLKLDVAGNIYIVDTKDNAVRVINTQPSAITIAGVTIAPNTIATVAGTWTACSAPTASPACGDTGLASAALLKTPRGVYVDNSGNIYITDNGDYRVRKVNAATGIITTVAGSGSSGFSGDGGQATSATFASMHGLYVDTLGQIYIADDTNNRVRFVNTSGVISTLVGSASTGNTVGVNETSAALTYPGDVLLDAAGDLYLPTQSNVVDMVGTGGIVANIAGTGNTSCSAATATTASNCYTGDGGSALSAMLSIPQSIAVDMLGNLYVADGGNNVVRKISVGAGAVAFGTQATGSSSAAYTTTVTNTGGQTLALSSVSAGTPFALASVASACSSTTSIAPGATCEVGTVFSPTTTGVFTGSASLASNSVNATAGVNAIALTGTGVQVAAAVSFASGPPASVYAGGNPGTVSVDIVDSLGRVVTGDDADTITLTVSGPGSVTGSPFAATVVNGVATFNLSTSTLSVAGQYTYTASSGSLTSASAYEGVVSNLYSASTPTGGTTGSAVPVTVSITAAGTLSNTVISSMGTPGNAFAIVSGGGTCSVGTVYALGQTCTVMVTLTPTGPNLLTGRLQLLDAGSNVLGTAYASSLRYK
jgi:hypothetical protein